MLNINNGIPSNISSAMRNSHSSGVKPKRTPLYQVHAEHGAKFIDFFGWEMPVLYEPTGVMKEVQACRTGAAIFDVSHMAQLKIHGDKRKEFIERVTVADLEATPEFGLRYTIVPNENGGCVDDAIVTNLDGHLHMIVNSACFDKDMKHFNKHLADFPGVTIENLYKTHALIALQGPTAEAVLLPFLYKEDREKLKNLPFMTRMYATVGGIENVTISRCGYTGEDGFEISIPIKYSQDLCRALARCPGVAMAGLGSRDTLRLEAALSLYGNDLEQDISLVEAGLVWAMTKRRKQEGGFIGAKEILRQIKEGPPRKRVGLIVSGAPARDGALLFDKNKKEIGRVTSGGPAPTIGKNVGLGLVKAAFAKKDTELLVKVRDKFQPAVVSKMPFFPHRYKPADK